MIQQISAPTVVFMRMYNIYIFRTVGVLRRSVQQCDLDAANIDIYGHAASYDADAEADQM